jgi:N-acetylglucosaminyldiphosphoundecaprenol N-acetyl-beta-D-mannosaminyltransferase
VQPVIEDASAMENRCILGQRVDATSYENTAARVLSWAKKRKSRYVCVTNVQVAVEGWNDAAYCKVINEGDLVIPDLLPLVFGLRALAILPANQRKKNQEEEFYLKVRGRECEEYTFSNR